MEIDTAKAAGLHKISDNENHLKLIPLILICLKTYFQKHTSRIS